jgi:hypothetical protein
MFGRHADVMSSTGGRRCIGVGRIDLHMSPHSSEVVASRGFGPKSRPQLASE